MRPLILFVGVAAASAYRAGAPLKMAADSFNGQLGWLARVKTSFAPSTEPAYEPPLYKSMMAQKRLAETKGIDHIFEQNEAWRRGKLEQDAEYFSRTVGAHRPSYLWIGPCDSRVDPAMMLGEEINSVLVHRNVGNQILNTDVNVMSAVQYAVDYLEVPHIIVCGSYDCWAVRAATSTKDPARPLEDWVRGIRDVMRMHAYELGAIEDEEERHRRLCEINTVEQCLNLFKTAAVQRRRSETRRGGRLDFEAPQIHAVIYEPADGKLKKLDVDFEAYMASMDGIYDLS